MLNAVDFLGRENWGCILGFGILGFGTIGGDDPRMGGVLGVLGFCVLKSLERAVNVFGH